MKLNFKNNFFGYFSFYYSVIGRRIYVNLLLCVVVSFLDGIGLAMFMPLLQGVNSSNVSSSPKDMGQLSYLLEGIEKLGLPLTINTLLLFLVFLFLFKGIIKFIQLNYQVNMRFLFMRKIRFTLLNNLQGLTYKGFLKLDAGKIQNTLIGEVQRLFNTMTYYFNSFQAAVMLLTYILLAILANYQFALLVALGAGLSNFMYRRIYISTKKASLDLSKKGDAFNGFLIQAIHYFKYLKSTNYFKKFSNKLISVIDQTEHLNKRMGFYNAITTSLREPMIISIVALVIFIQVTWLESTLSSILLSLLLFYRALTFLMTVQNNWQTFIANVGALNSITATFAEMNQMQEQDGKILFHNLENGIKFTDVVFSYGEKKVLNDINISIPKNKTTAFIGESGSGKTTLANMVAGLILPSKGELHVDNHKINELNFGTYRDKIGYISQDPVIFSDTIFNNVTFWAENTEENMERFWKIIELASLETFVKSQSDLENTKLGDNGILISGGQKQRISIARELYKEVEILIMDEATSALDSETERIIQENIEKLHGSYTIIIIAHRLSTIKDADIIYLLENGRVSASGRFDEMIEKSPRFKSMVTLQEF